MKKQVMNLLNTGSRATALPLKNIMTCTASITDVVDFARIPIVLNTKISARMKKKTCKNKSPFTKKSKTFLDILFCQPRNLWKFLHPDVASGDGRWILREKAHLKEGH